jgi:hypothetical protein
MKIGDIVAAPYRGNWCRAEVLKVTPTRAYLKIHNRSGWAITAWRTFDQLRFYPEIKADEMDEVLKREAVK